VVGDVRGRLRFGDGMVGLSSMPGATSSSNGRGANS
jgi:hypothetical protein